MKYILKPAMTLFITAVIVVAVLSIVFNFTKEPIERQKRRTQEAAMKEVLPSASEYREIQTEKTGSIVAVYEGIHNNDLTGYVVQLSPQGYSGNIDMIVGISLINMKITGMRVIKHTETPGLGALAVKRNFYYRYNNLPLARLEVVRAYPRENEIQAITSATITTKAITDAVNEAIEWFKKRGEE
jgi:electron transport complex protein RnfG